MAELKAGSKVSQLRHLAESVGQLIQQGQPLTGAIEGRFALDLKTRASQHTFQSRPVGDEIVEWRAQIAAGE
jgi:hypothetical protein